MGIQSWKRGVHTGNTIRVGGSCAQIRSLGIQSGLIKRQVSPPSAVTAPFLEPEEERKRVRRRGGRAKKVTQETKRSVEVEELEELEENVFYSLNKKGRWNLPEMIRTEIKYSKYTPKGQSEVRRSATEDEVRLDQDLTMVQCHPLKRGSNCFAVTSTKLPGDGTVSKSKNYLNANSVLQKKTKQRLRPNKKRKSATPQVEKAQEKPTTEIEISCPYPRNSFLQYGEKPRNRGLIYRYTKQLSRRKLSSEEICDIMKTDAYCDRKYCCIDDAYAEDKCRAALTTHQPDNKDRKSKVERSKTVAQPDEDSYVWFLGEFVQKPSSEFQDDTAEEEGEQREIEEEQNANLDNENVLNKVANDSSLEIPGVSEESEDWELLENEVPSEGEEFHEGDNGILAMLIEDALVRKTNGLQISQEDSRINRRKNKKRK